MTEAVAVEEAGKVEPMVATAATQAYGLAPGVEESAAAEMVAAAMEAEAKEEEAMVVAAREGVAVEAA